MVLAWLTDNSDTARKVPLGDVLTSRPVSA
jgi:hypothetical protein